tara:strand:+ start:29 stop:313 length:285 start_codon:yes stop_codon:yes gene_type:complete
MIDAIEEEVGVIALSVGDIIIDKASGDVGVLMERIHRIDMALDDMYFWKIRWTSLANGEDDRYLNNYLEEDYLKMSIFLGIMKWQSIKGDSIEL